jgi:hypothetical protein
MGRIFDERGNRMTPSYAVKNTVRYRYYISAALIQGQPDKAATLNRIPAAEIETLIISTLRKHLAGESNNRVEAESSHSLNDKELISAYVARVDVKRDHLAVHLSVKPDQRGGERDQELRTRHARSFKLKHYGRPLAEDCVKTTAGDYSPRVDILSSRPPSNPRRDPRQARHRDREGAALAR